MAITPQTINEINRLAELMGSMFAPAEFYPGCEVKSVADKDLYATDNGWIEAVVGQHNQQRCRWRGQFPNVQVGDYVDVLFFASYRLFVVFGQGGSSALSRVNLLHKLDATTDPTISDDNDDGYSVGSVWINVTDGKAFICSDATAGAAVWDQINRALAAQAETDAGTDDERVVTPLKLASVPVDHVKVSKLVASDGSPDPALNIDAVGDVFLNGKQAFRSTDAWLRLNQDGDFTNGVYTPGPLRADGGWLLQGAGWLVGGTTVTNGLDVSSGVFGLPSGTTVNDIDIVAANNDNALITSGGVWDHTQATAGVHGLAANEHVLGSNVSGHKVESGSRSVAVTTLGNVYYSVADHTVTFPLAFSATPVVVACSQDVASMFSACKSITTTGFLLRGGAAGPVTASVGWIAKGA